MALLMALCLLAGLAVTPAAAEGESVETLRQELATAEAAEKQAQSEYDTAKRALETANADIAAVDAAKEARDSAEEAYNKAQNPTEGEVVDLEDLKAKFNAADKAYNEAQIKAETAKTQLPTLQSTEAEKSKALSDAQEVVKNKKAALEEAEKNQTQTPPTTPSSSDLYYSSSVDFGKLAKGTSSASDLTRTFTITNRSSYDMTLSSGSVSGYTISGASGTLSAGSSLTVTVRLDSANSVGSYNGTLSMSATFKDGSGSYPFSVPIYAEVVDSSYSLSINPSSKDFGKLAEGYEEKTATDMAVTVTLENKGASSVQMNGVKGNDHFTVTAVKSDSEILKNGEKTDYKISPKKGLALGTYTDTITFQTKEGTTASFKATVVVEKKLDPLSAEPSTLNFGIVEEGYTALNYQTVTLKNNSDHTMLLTQPTSYSYEISALSQSTLASGSSVSLNVRPRTGLPAGYYSGVIEINTNGEQAKVNVQFTVTRPAGPTTFTDVPSDSTFAADIAYVSQKGLMSGKGGGVFKPQDPVTRGQLVTILYRLEGQPAVSGVGFSDVAAGSYCEKAVKWAAATGITTGGNDGLFRPNDSITREQLATFLYRYNRHKGYFTLAFADLSTFPDVGSVSSYAKDALSWANGAKLVNGTGDGRLNPSGGATRGQAAAILHRYCTSIGR